MDVLGGTGRLLLGQTGDLQQNASVEADALRTQRRLDIHGGWVRSHVRVWCLQHVHRDHRERDDDGRNDGDRSDATVPNSLPLTLLLFSPRIDLWFGLL